MLLDRWRTNWRHVAAPRAWQAFSTLRLQLAGIAAATAAMAYRGRSRAIKCLQAGPKKGTNGRLEALEERIRRQTAIHRITAFRPRTGRTPSRFSQPCTSTKAYRLAASTPGAPGFGGRGWSQFTAFTPSRSHSPAIVARCPGVEPQ